MSNNTAIGVLAYNEEKNLESTLSEVSNNFDEVIIVNDGSKDKTQEILNKLNIPLNTRAEQISKDTYYKLSSFLKK